MITCNYISLKHTTILKLMPNIASKLSRMSEKFWLVLFFFGGWGWRVIVTTVFNQWNLNTLLSFWWSTQGNRVKMLALTKFLYVRIRENLVPNCSLQWTRTWPFQCISWLKGYPAAQARKFHNASNFSSI